MKSTRRGSFSVHRSEKTPGSKYSSTSGLSPRGHLERQAEFHRRPPAGSLSASESGSRPATTRRPVTGLVPDIDVLACCRMPVRPDWLDVSLTSSRALSTHVQKGQYIVRLTIDRKSTRLNSSHQLISYAVF